VHIFVVVIANDILQYGQCDSRRKRGYSYRGAKLYYRRPTENLTILITSITAASSSDESATLWSHTDEKSADKRSLV